MFVQWMIMWHLQGMHPEEYFVLGGLSTSFRCKFNAVTRWRQMYFQKKVNTYQSRHSLDSKVVFNQLFADLLHREWRTFDAIDLEAFLERHGKAIAKPLGGSGGKSIELVDWRNFSVQRKAEYLKQIKQSKNHIIEEVLTQTGFTHQVNPSSVNTLRVNTLKYDNKVVCLGTFFRTGRAGEIIDNLHAGGIFWQLNSHSGEIIFGTDSEGHYFSTHPDTGIVLSGAFIPKHQEAIEMCLNIHKRVPAIPQVGWDLAISESSIALIEANSQSGFWNMDEEGAVWRELKAFMFNLK